MESNCVIGKVRDLSSVLDNYIIKRIKEENMPILKNHIPLFYILSEKDEPMLFNEIKRQWNISKSSLSDIISKYESLGIINKCSSSEDKRSVFISATEEAEKIKEKLDEIEDEILDLLLVDFDNEERALFEKILDKALKNSTKIL